MATRTPIVALLGVAAMAWLTGCAARGPAAPPRAPQARSSATNAPAVVRTALGLVGTPYRAGGQRPETGFDCSGFVTWVFERHGLTLPRTVAGQFQAGRSVRPAPRAADLVFFSTEAPGPSHVGIALGDGRFVHAPSSRGVVRVERLQGSYWARRLVGTRRVLEP